MIACCPGGAAFDGAEAFSGDLAPWISTTADGGRELDLIVPELRAPASVPVIESALEALPGILSARVNFTGGRIAARWRDPEFRPASILETLERLGFAARPFDPAHSGLAADDARSRLLLRSVAVSGFAAANIMLLSVSVWSGADGVTRDLFHLISAAIALPAVAYAGRPFFRSAARALSNGRFNMDVPISLAVCLAALMSLYETFNRGEAVYFDASVTLLFFLLTGRYLDHAMRARARSAVSQLLSLSARAAMIEAADGSRRLVTAAAIRPGMTMLVAAGERLAADGRVIAGASEIDRSLITGESRPELARAGSEVHAGMLNLSGPLHVAVTAAGEDTFLAEITRLMAVAEQSRSRFVRIADRLARVYSPAVHILAGATLAGWLIATGGDWHAGLMAAMAVLIITCPCALGLAVPAVQAVASGFLFRQGVMIKDGAALEKLAGVDTVVFDKTGTLTLGRPRLVNGAALAPSDLAVAAGLAQASRHPLSRAVWAAAEARGIAPARLTAIAEVPGCGLTGLHEGGQVKLGARAWCGLASDGHQSLAEFVLARQGRDPAVFAFDDALRPGAARVVSRLEAQGLTVEILSGDRAAAVARTARALGVAKWQAAVPPQEKLAYVESLKAAGRKVLMVGDGINDAPALAAGHASLAPASASDIGRTAADAVFTGESLEPVLRARDIARRAQRLSVQNFALAIGYNVFAVPVAMLGYASPLIAAAAMSTSSIIVVANALRLGWGVGTEKAVAAAAPALTPAEARA